MYVDRFEGINATTITKNNKIYTFNTKIRNRSGRKKKHLAEGIQSIQRCAL